MNKFMLLLSVCALAACEKPYIVDAGEDDDQVVAPGDGRPAGEVLWAENDTARLMCSGPRKRV